MSSILRGFRVAALVPVFLGALAAGPAEAAEWTRDQRAGCAVWNPNPQPNEIAMWFGACVDGRAAGTGILQWLQNGQPETRIEGEFRDGKRNGLATVFYKDGSIFEGGFVDDERSGFGRYTEAGGTFEGEFSHNELISRTVSVKSQGATEHAI